MTDKPVDLAAMLRQQGWEEPSSKASQVGGFGSFGGLKWRGVVVNQNLLSPVPATNRAQEPFVYDTLWPTDRLTSVAVPGVVDWTAANALWRERQLNLALVVMGEKINSVSQQIAELKQEISRLQSLRAYVVPLTTLSSRFQLTRPVPVTIEGDGETFTATFVEANLSASGETESDAVANFKDSLLSTYQVLEAMPPDKLGPLPARQWEVLQNAVRRIQE